MLSIDVSSNELPSFVSVLLLLSNKCNVDQVPALKAAIITDSAFDGLKKFSSPWVLLVSKSISIVNKNQAAICHKEEKNKEKPPTRRYPPKHAGHAVRGFFPTVAGCP